MNQHSNFIGGSNAAARIACPASWSMEQKLPASVVKESSFWADEGSACHAAMAAIMEDEIRADDCIGKTFPPYVDHPITVELYRDAIAPCLDFFDNLDAELGGIEYFVEKRVEIPTLPGVFGTCDLIGRGADRSVIIDWKFGAGESVYAWYEEADGTMVPNEQLMFYLLGALHTCPAMFEIDNPDWHISICIGQPRHRDGPNFDIHTVTIRDVVLFQDRLHRAATLAKSDNPPMAKGPHCRFMACKSICPLHTGPMLDVGTISNLMTRMQLEAAVDGGEGGGLGATVDWGKTYSLMLDLANRIEPVIREWRSQAQAYLEDGNPIPSWKLVGKRASRKWTRPDKSVERRLQRMGLTKDERAPRELVTPPQAEKLLKKLGKGLPEGYFDAVSSGTTLAPDSDPRQAVEPVGDVITALTKALSTVRG